MSGVVADRARVKEAFEQPTLSLLHQGHAPVVIAVFRSAFSREVPAVPAARLHEMVEAFLAELRLSGLADREVPAGSGRGLCRKWVSDQWLIRSPTEDGTEQYTLTSHAQDALRLVEQLTRERATLSEHRIATILEQVRRFNRVANPDRAARVNILDAEIGRLTRERDRLLAGGDMPAVGADYMLQGFSELTELVAGLPSDFARVSESFTTLRDQIFVSLRGEDRPAGQTVDEYLRQADSLEEATPEGRAFKGAFDLLRDQVLVEQLREDIADLLDHPLAGDILTDSDRADLRGTVSMIRRGMSRVIVERGRATSALKEFITTYDRTRDRELDATLRALESEITVWMLRGGPKTRVPVSLLPAEIEVSLLRERFHDAETSAPPPPLVDVSADQPAAPSMRELLMQGGPSLDALRARLSTLGTSGAPDSAGGLFRGFPNALRRPVEIYGLLHLATNTDALAVTEETEVYDTVRPDGSRRSLEVPKIVPAHGPATAGADDGTTAAVSADGDAERTRSGNDSPHRDERREESA